MAYLEANICNLNGYNLSNVEWARTILKAHVPDEGHSPLPLEQPHSSLLVN